MKQGTLRRTLGILLGSAILVVPLSSVWALDLPPNIEALVQKGKSTERDGTDYDNQTQNFQMKVIVRSREFARDFHGFKATLFVIGRDTTSKVFTMLDRVSSEFDLPHKAEHTFKGERVTLQFDDNAVAKFGTKYDGYLLVIRDADGKVIQTAGGSPSYLQNLDKLEKINKGQKFSPKFDLLDIVR